MSKTLILLVFLAYTGAVFFIAWLTSRRSNNDSYFTGNKSSPWFVVAYGMIGASLSGVTFMSVPGWVNASHFSYMLVVFGYLIGYIVIALILLPLYYRLNLTSIYTYLEQRFGLSSYKTGSLFFILSRLIGSSFRMFLVVNVLHYFLFAHWGIPFAVTTLIFIAIILLYSFKGGIKTIVWTDTLQTTFMILAVIISIFIIADHMSMSLPQALTAVFKSDYFTFIETDLSSKNHYLKQFLSGVFICIAMTGLDQDMMQKNLSCRNLRDAQKNMLTFSVTLIFINFMFLTLGALLYLYSENLAIDISPYISETTDNLFPALALKHLGVFAGLTFLIGLVSAAYSSADGSLTALTTAFSIDILNIRKKGYTDEKIKKTRYIVHLSFAAITFLIIIFYKLMNNDAIISKIFTVAGYTYGPLLGLFAFGLFTKWQVRDRFVPVVCLLSPVLCYILSANSQAWLNGYVFGFELLIINGLITFAGLVLLSTKGKVNALKTEK